MSPARCLSIDTPIGVLTLHEAGNAIIEVTWEADADVRPTPLLENAARQLREYFDHRRSEFDLPLSPHGTDFQRSVWDELKRIPYGETRTYGDVAAALDSAPRAVGGACGRNPIPVLIPCHRVVGAGGKLTGYSGGNGLATKSVLLGHEIPILDTSPREGGSRLTQ